MQRENVVVLYSLIALCQPARHDLISLVADNPDVQLAPHKVANAGYRENLTDVKARSAVSATALSLK